MKKEIQLLISEEFAEKIIPENDSVRLFVLVKKSRHEKYYYLFFDFEKRTQVVFLENLFFQK